MSLFAVILFAATFLCALVAGFVFAFANVVMPGIRRLNDRDFLRAFKQMDAVIQRNEPLFMLVWLGSVVALVVAMLLGLWQLQGVERLLLLIATAAYVLGVQLPTFTVNVPLNNRLQVLDLDSVSDTEIQAARHAFETRWVRWNTIRALVASLSTGMLSLILFRL